MNVIQKWLATRAERRRQDRVLTEIVAAMKREHEAVCQDIARQIVMKRLEAAQKEARDDAGHAD